MKNIRINLSNLYIMKAKTLQIFMLTMLLCLFTSISLKANNIEITTQPRKIAPGAGVSTGYYGIQFDLKWDNSWKSSNPRNFDAAWLFVKYSIGGDSWKHCWLSDTTASTAEKNTIEEATGEKNGVGSAVEPIEWAFIPGKSKTADGSSHVVGLFLHRTKNGYGSVSFKNVTLKWKFVDQNVLADDPVMFKVFAIEMVYVNEGVFSVGDGTNASNTFPFSMSYQVEPYKILSEDEMTVVPYSSSSSSADKLCLSFIGNTTRMTVPAAFPKGYKAFFMMKHEISQEAYVDYLNTLDITQQAARIERGGPLAASWLNSSWSGSIISSAASAGNQATAVTNANRNGVVLSNIGGTGTFACNTNFDATVSQVNAGKSLDGQNIAMNYLSTEDWLSYLAWAGLRPLTELEFEKASRGPLSPVKDEFVWGSTSITECTGNLLNGGLLNEVDRNTSDEKAALNAGTPPNVNRLNAPLRVGSFADAATTRIQAGAAYWGALDLSGNVAERYVEVVNTGLSFSGKHGDGTLEPLTADAPLNRLGWPSNYAAAYTVRGSGAALAVSPVTSAMQLSNLQTSDRSLINVNFNEASRRIAMGGRGGRTVNTDE